MRETRRLARRVMGRVTTCASLWLVGASPPGRNSVCRRSPLGRTGRLRRRHHATKPCSWDVSVEGDAGVFQALEDVDLVAPFVDIQDPLAQPKTREGSTALRAWMLTMAP